MAQRTVGAYEAKTHLDRGRRAGAEMTAIGDLETYQRGGRSRCLIPFETASFR
jgi:hypothetical protein